MRYRPHSHHSNLLRAVVSGIICVLVFQSGLYASAQTQDRGNGRQLIQPNAGPPAGRVERRVALVIGNAGYRNVPRLANPVNDARDMAEALRSLGFIVTLREDQTAEQMREEILQFGDLLKSGGGVGLFYYAGHGVQVGGRNYLIPVEASVLYEKRMEFDAVDVNRVLVEMEEAGNGFNIVVLDACRSNPFSLGWRSSEGGLAQLSAPKGTLVAYATAPGRVADDGHGHNGLYTGELLKQMRVPGQTIEAMFKAVRANVRALTNDGQVPWESTSLVGDFYFAGAAADRAAAESEFWYSIKDSQSPEDFNAYLREYPNGVYSALARNSLRRLAGRKVAEPAPVSADAQPPLKRAAVSAERLNQAAALVKSGDAHRMRNELDAAVADLTESIRLDPNNSMAYAIRGSAYHARGAEDLAILDFTEAIRIDPNSSWAFAQRCLSYISKGSKELALSDINEVIRLEPKNYWAYQIRATIYHNLGQHVAAVADEQREMNDLNGAIQKSPQDSDRYTDRCNAFRVRLQLDLALADCNEAIRLNPKSGTAYTARGDVYNLKGDYNRAIADLSEAVRLLPSYYWAYERRADVYRKVGLSLLAEADEAKAAALKAGH